MSASACAGVPVSWPRLERFAAGDLRGAAASEIEAHVAACATCRACLDEIRADVVALPPLPAAPARAPAWWSRWIFAGGGLALAAAAIVLLLARRTPSDERTDRVAVKGAGVVVLSVVRERDGVIAYDPTTFRKTDQIKVRVTCDPGPSIWAEVIVYQRNTTAIPFAPAQVPCGNATVVPGAFRIVDGGPARVCVSLATGLAPAPPTQHLACVDLTEE